MKSSSKPRDRPEPKGLLDLTKMDRVQFLRESIAEADELFRMAKDAETKRTAILIALGAVLQFNRSLVPSIKSVALTSHYENLADLFVRQDDTLKRSAGPALTRSLDQGARDAFIAAAFKILTEGGKRKGNMNRRDAGKFIAAELRKCGIKDRGTNFTKERVKNIYLETITPRNSIFNSPRNTPTSLNAVGIAVYRSRIQALPHIMYADILKPIEALNATSKDANTVPALLRTIGDRKRLAVGFIECAARLSDPKRQ